VGELGCEVLTAGIIVVVVVVVVPRRLKQFEKAQSDKQKKALAGLFDRMSAEEEKPPATSSAQQ
jgi:hypothetical protein